MGVDPSEASLLSLGADESKLRGSSSLADHWVPFPGKRREHPRASSSSMTLLFLPSANPRLTPGWAGPPPDTDSGPIIFAWRECCATGATMVLTLHALEASGVVLSGGGWLCSLATTLMSTWLTSSTELLPTESYELGLWGTCVVQEQGVLQCRAYGGILGLPLDIKLGRILMCLMLAVGLCGFLLAASSTQLVSCRHGPLGRHCHQKAMKTAGAALCVAAGILGMVPVSRIAHLAVIRYHDKSVPEVVPRWEFGDALFCGWTAGVLHLLAGTLLLISCLCSQTESPDTGTPMVPLGRLHSMETV